MPYTQPSRRDTQVITMQRAIERGSSKATLKLHPSERRFWEQRGLDVTLPPKAAPNAKVLCTVTGNFKQAIHGLEPEDM